LDRELCKGDQERLSALTTLMGFPFNAYRELRASTAYCIPALQVHHNDLAKARAMQDGHDSIHWSKYIKMAEIISYCSSRLGPVDVNHQLAVPKMHLNRKTSFHEMIKIKKPKRQRWLPPTLLYPTFSRMLVSREDDVVI